jgi:hypothetical protein
VEDVHPALAYNVRQPKGRSHLGWLPQIKREKLDVCRKVGLDLCGHLRRADQMKAEVPSIQPSQ